MVNTQGRLWVDNVDAANRADGSLVKAFIVAIIWRVGERLEKSFGDQAYNRVFATALAEWSIDFERAARPESLRGFVPVAKRWVVERSIFWTNLFRRVVKDYERTVSSSVAWLYLASSQIMLNGLRQTTEHNFLTRSKRMIYLFNPVLFVTSAYRSRKAMCKSNQANDLRDFDSSVELVNYFDIEDKCVQYLAELRWNGKPQCPYCEHEHVYELKGRFPRWKCAQCREHFSVRVGTIFEDSKLPLRKWFFAIYLATARKKGISSHQLARDIKVTQKTAWFMLHRIQLAFAAEVDKTQLSSEVEIDKTYVGGKEKNKHKSKRTTGIQGRSVKNKVPVALGVLQRNGKIYAVPVENTSGETILPIIAERVEPGSKVYVDEYHPYKALNPVYEQSIVQHSANNT